jgi:hypothetical protein
MGKRQLITQAEKILKAGTAPAYRRVYVYEGCSEEACGPMPRVIVQWVDSVAVCYSLGELQERFGPKVKNTVGATP